MPKAVRQFQMLTCVAKHRKIFFRISWMDYTTLRHRSLRLFPDEVRSDDEMRNANVMQR